ncbi:MAG: phytanoyl-CoA dioxygenase family protein [Acidimicrobiales bacterium]
MHDQELQVRLDQDGFVVVPFLAPAVLDEVRAWRAAIGSAPGDPGIALFNDTWSTERAHRASVAEALGRWCQPAIDALLVDHVALAWTTIVKWPGEPGAVVAHRDPTFVDEAMFRSIGIWCPLEDVDAATGTLSVIPGSHRGGAPVRAHQAEANLLVDLDLRADPRLVQLDVPAGAAIVYDHALVHGSVANGSDRPRVVVAGVLVPRAAEARYAVQGPDGEVHDLAVGPELFVDERLDQLDVDAVLGRYPEVGSPVATSSVAPAPGRPARWWRRRRGAS